MSDDRLNCYNGYDDVQFIELRINAILRLMGLCDVQALFTFVSYHGQTGSFFFILCFP